MRRHPDPVGAILNPDSRPPQVAAAPDPATGNVEAGIGRLGDGRTNLDRSRRLWEILNLGLGLLSESLLRRDRFLPEARRPLPAALHLTPRTGHPDAARRRRSPETANPDVLRVLIVPVPVARHPLNVVPLRLLVGRQFLDGVGRLLGHDRRRGGGFGRGGERLVHRSPREHLGAIGHAARLGIGIAGLGGWRELGEWLLGGDGSGGEGDRSIRPGPRTATGGEVDGSWQILGGILGLVVAGGRGRGARDERNRRCARRMHEIAKLAPRTEPRFMPL